jgi:hypothetical protein
MKFLDTSELKQLGQRGDDKRYLCPFCEDRKGSSDHFPGHLHINLKMGVFHCFRCDASPRTTGIYLRLTSFQPLKRIPKIKKVSLPNDFYSLSESTDSFFPIYKEYANKRGVNKTDVKRYHVGFTADLSDPLFGRLIFCHYDEDTNKLDFIQGRSVFEGDKDRYYSPGDKPLFKSFKGSVKSGLIVEGIFDMIRSSRLAPSAALLQHLISEKQSQQIYDSFTKRIVLALDADASESIIPCMNKIKKREVIPVLLKKKDVDELSDYELKILVEKVYS